MFIRIYFEDVGCIYYVKLMKEVMYKNDFVINSSVFLS